MSTPRQIEFEDIREGDEIDVVWVSGDRTDIIRGTAHHKDAGGWWKTPQGELLVVSSGDGTIFLRRRPVPEEPEGLGVVVRSDEGDEYISVNSEPGTPRWVYVEATNQRMRWAVEWATFDPDSMEVKQ